MRNKATSFFKSLQDNICNSLEKLDGKSKFHEHEWTRKDGGGGRTRVIEDGNIFEKGGVNFSAVYGKLPAESLLHAKGVRQIKNSGDNHYFYAAGLSVVMHPLSPMIPIVHMNVRYFELYGNPASTPQSLIAAWFGGGIDLTPHYVNPEDARDFHRRLKKVCDNFSPHYYHEFKKWADDYFFIKHRDETRGIGGIFFDRLSETAEFSITNRFDFTKAVGESLMPIYIHQVKRNKIRTYGKKEIEWQQLRRGRYVEFNLLYDRGTKFGLETGGRTESILMSLPKNASWIYDYNPSAGSPEKKSIGFLKKGIDWIK